MKTPYAISSLLMAIAVFFYNTTALALSYNYTTNIIADGFVDTYEWNHADYEADNNGLSSAMGAMYAQMSIGYQAGTKHYTGKFQYLLHNIEQLQTNEDADYNSFDVYDTSGTLALTIWVFDNVDESSDQAWMDAAGLSGYPSYPTINDTGFVVYNHIVNQYRKYNFGDTRPEDGGYDWDYYWGVYGAGGFNNSAFENGLKLSIDNNNEVYEVIYRDSAILDKADPGGSDSGGSDPCGSDPGSSDPGGSDPGSSDPGGVSAGLRRGVKDPDGPPTSQLIDYFDDDITPPDPTLVFLADPLKVTALENSVLIEWKTDMEVDNAGFHLWRSETKSGEYIKITDKLIPAQGSGSQYTFTDNAVVKGKTYYYKLEDIDLNGTSTFHDSASTKRSNKGLLPATQFLLRN